MAKPNYDTHFHKLTPDEVGQLRTWATAKTPYPTNDIIHLKHRILKALDDQTASHPQK